MYSFFSRLTRIGSFFIFFMAFLLMLSTPSSADVDPGNIAVSNVSFDPITYELSFDLTPSVWIPTYEQQWVYLYKDGPFSPAAGNMQGPYFNPIGAADVGSSHACYGVTHCDVILNRFQYDTFDDRASYRIMLGYSGNTTARFLISPRKPIRFPAPTHTDHTLLLKEVASRSPAQGLILTEIR
jgi:hypothetical protein